MMKAVLAWAAALLVASALTGGVSVANARNRALLIGVSTYIEAEKQQQDPAGGRRVPFGSLDGPRNDVTVMWRLLRQRNFDDEQITVLTDGLPMGSDFPQVVGPPTRAAILRALTALARSAQKGDFVVIHFSGHGTRQPEAPGQAEPEPDGLDQVLLPADAGAYDEAAERWTNGLTDNEIKQALDAIRAKGAFVWVIVDACHSGSVTRASGAKGVRVRGVDLPVSVKPRARESRLRPGARQALLPPGGARQQGGLVGFYAVDSRFQAIEKPFPGYEAPLAGTPSRESLGLFTYHLHRALARGEAGSFRELGQQIAAEMAAQSSQHLLPLFDGALDHALFSGERFPSQRFRAQVSGETIAISAGVVHGLTPGSRLRIYGGLGKDAQPVGTAVLTDARAVESRGTFARDGSGPEPSAHWAQLESLGVSLRYKVARPFEDEIASAPEARATVEAVAGDPQHGGTVIEVLPAGSPDAHMQLRIRDGRIWLIPLGQEWNTTPGAYGETMSVPLVEQPRSCEVSLRCALWRFARSANLLRLAASGTAADGPLPERLEVKFELRRVPARSAVDPQAPCSTKSAGLRFEARNLKAGETGAVGHCDEVHLSVRSRHDRPVDLTALYIDSRGGIGLLDARLSAATGCTMEIGAGAKQALNMSTRILTWEANPAGGRPSTVGAEHIVLIAAERAAGGASPALCSLTQPTLELTRSAGSREAAQGPTAKLIALLREAGGVDGTRSARRARAWADPDAADDASSIIRLYKLQVTPPDAGLSH